MHRWPLALKFARIERATALRPAEQVQVKKLCPPITPPNRIALDLETEARLKTQICGARLERDRICEPQDAWAANTRAAASSDARALPIRKHGLMCKCQ